MGLKGSEYVTNTYQSVLDQGLTVKKLGAEEATSLFPYIKFSSGDETVWEEKDSGRVAIRMSHLSLSIKCKML